MEFIRDFAKATMLVILVGGFGWIFTLLVKGLLL